YALDFSKNKCDAYDQPALSVGDGFVRTIKNESESGGYGYMIDIDHGNNIISRYAHLITDSVGVKNGEKIWSGQTLGKIGNTGFVYGESCPDYPGTHLHFSMYEKQPDGTLASYKPEPISGYTDLAAGNWYASDNELYNPRNIADAGGGSLAGRIIEGASNLFSKTASAISVAIFDDWIIVFGPDGTTIAPNRASTSSPAISSSTIASGPPSIKAATTSVNTIADNPSPNNTTSSISQNNAATSSAVVNGPGQVAGTSTSPSPVDFGVSSSPSPVGGISVGNGYSSPPEGPTPSESQSLPPAGLPNIENFSAEFSVGTLSIDFSWNPLTLPSPTSSYIYVVDEVGETTSTPVAETTSSIASIDVVNFGRDYLFSIQAFENGEAVSRLSTTTVSVPDLLTTIQPEDTDISHWSWYSDNWYELGTGFYGTVYAMMLEGYVDASDYLASHISLLEFTDPEYRNLNRTFVISDNAPFTATTAKVTTKGLEIPLQPNKYYLLKTLQDRQNASVILRGTSATGTAMWNEFVYGAGRTEYVYSFYPYLEFVMRENFPALQPPNPPPSVSFEFDEFNHILNISWASSTDPDTTDNLLRYEVNISTSTELLPENWKPASGNSTTTRVVYPNSYTVGVLAIDDFNATSTPTVLTWNFPLGFTPLPEQLNHSAEIGRGRQKITLTSTATIDGVAMWMRPLEGIYCCSESFLRIHMDDNGVVGESVATSSPVSFNRYYEDHEEIYSFGAPVILAPGSYWLVPVRGPSDPTNQTVFFGSGSDSYPGGIWVDQSDAETTYDAYFRLHAAP
ncbi:MAG: peptidoglycan DD-metalloendopeptidase family protein, partial [Patescibacteria group bacterium]